MNNGFASSINLILYVREIVSQYILEGQCCNLLWEKREVGIPTSRFSQSKLQHCDSKMYCETISRTYKITLIQAANQIFI